MLDLNNPELIAALKAMQDSGIKITGGNQKDEALKKIKETT